MNEAELLTKVNNIYVMLMMSLMDGKLDRVSHFISENLQNKEQTKIDEWNQKNEQPIFGELNVKESTVISTQTFDEYEEVKVLLIGRYLDYVLDKTTGNIKYGDTSNRVEYQYVFRLTKKKDVKKRGLVYHCPSCGASLDINNTGVCSYCGEVSSVQNYDWIVADIEKI